jgi:hypothetical protein
MKTIIYISGIAGTILLVLRIVGIFSPVFQNDLLLYTGGGLIFLVFIPLMIRDKSIREKKIDEIIQSYKDKKSKKTEIKKNHKLAKGWNMNNSPFRKRRSGLNWGGGNVHAANAERGTRRGFRNN